MDQERIYIGIRRAGLWHVYPAENITEAELQGVDVMHDLQSTVVTGAMASTVKTKIIWQASFGHDPSLANATRWLAGPPSRLDCRFAAGKVKPSTCLRVACSIMRRRCAQNLQF
jgi:hypothetical protein